MTLCVYALLAVGTGLWCAGTGEVQFPRVHDTLGGNAIRGQGLRICSESIERNIKHKKKMGLSKMKEQKEPVSRLPFGQLVWEG